MILQVISVCPKDSRIIQQSGAHRIQLVSALQVGGLTPPSTIIRKSLEAVQIPTNILIRHHNNGFIYTPEQKQLLLEDIQQCKDRFKPNGVVIGAICKSKSKQCQGLIPTQILSIDQEFLSDVIKEVGGKMTVTFHKASDQTSDLCQTVQVLSRFGVSTVLTQGGTKPITQNFGVLQQMIEKKKTNILLGGGINHDNISEICVKLKPSQVHIGTCVRQPKYGNVDKELLNSFITKIKQWHM